MNKKNFSYHEIPDVALEQAVTRALAEDVGTGDMTSEACIDPSLIITAKAVARHPLVVCGNAVAKEVFRRVDPSLTFSINLDDGAVAEKGATLWIISGNARSVLLGERVALNFIQRMSGIATATKSFVDAIPEGCTTRIADTRKTMPGLRVFDRYAVRAGGGFNHRDNLSSAILIKDNHIAACGSVTTAIQRAKKHASRTCKVECEVDTLDQLKEAIAAGVDIVLLDNMDLKTIGEAIKIAKGKALIEASGGVTLDKVAAFAKAGVEIISVGALTHSVKAADIGLDM